MNAKEIKKYADDLKAAQEQVKEITQISNKKVNIQLIFVEYLLILLLQLEDQSISFQNEKDELKNKHNESMNLLREEHEEAKKELQSEINSVRSMNEKYTKNSKLTIKFYKYSFKIQIKKQRFKLLHLRKNLISKGKSKKSNFNEIQFLVKPRK